MITPARQKARAAAFEAYRKGLLAQILGCHERVAKIKRGLGIDTVLCNPNSLRIAETKLSEAMEALRAHDLRSKQRLGTAEEQTE